MVFLQFSGSAISFLIGFFIFSSAKSAIHETLAVTFLIVSAVLFAGAAITDGLRDINRNVKELSTRFGQIQSHVPESRPAEQSAAISPEDTPQPEKRVSWVEQAKKEIAGETAKT